MTPAELDALLRSKREPQYDENGKCLHARSRYIDFGTGYGGRHVCSDCHDIDFHNTWSKR